MLAPFIYAETTTTGTGSLTLSAKTGYPTVSDAFAVDEPLIYSILDSTGLPIEIGFGYLSASTTLVRHLVYATFVTSTLTLDAPAAVTLAAGTKQVRIAPSSHNIALNFPVMASHATANSKVILGGNYGTFSNGSMTWATQSGRVHFYPWYMPITAKCNAFAVRFGAVGTVDVGMYSVGSDGKPRTLLRGVTGHSATAAVNFLSFTAAVIKAGWYYMAMNCAATSTTSRLSTILSSPLGVDSGELLPASFCTLNQAQGTLPTSAAGVSDGRTDAGSPGQAPTFGLRVV